MKWTAKTSLGVALASAVIQAFVSGMFLIMYTFNGHRWVTLVIATLSAANAALQGYYVHQKSSISTEFQKIGAGRNLTIMTASALFWSFLCGADVVEYVQTRNPFQLVIAILSVLVVAVSLLSVKKGFALPKASGKPNE